MKKLIPLVIITSLILTTNANSVEDNNIENDKILKIGVLLPLSGNLETVGQAFLKAVQLGVHDLKNKEIKIYPKDSKGNALDAYEAGKEFENYFKKNQLSLVGKIIKDRKIICKMDNKDEFEVDISSLNNKYKHDLFN